MEHVKETRRAGLGSPHRTLASLLPLWLLSVAIMAEGFPRPPISKELAIASLVIAVAVSVALLWKRWVAIELLLYYGFFPFLLLSSYDEISTTYKTPFIVLCTLLLTAGVVGYQCSHSTRKRGWLVLLSVAVVTWVSAWHAASRFWEMAGDLGYGQCFPDASDCAPLTGQETPWWVLFFAL